MSESDMDNSLFLHLLLTSIASSLAAVLVIISIVFWKHHHPNPKSKKLESGKPEKLSDSERDISLAKDKPWKEHFFSFGDQKSLFQDIWNITNGSKSCLEFREVVFDPETRFRELYESSSRKKFEFNDSEDKYSSKSRLIDVSNSQTSSTSKIAQFDKTPSNESCAVVNKRRNVFKRSSLSSENQKIPAGYKTVFPKLEALSKYVDPVQSLSCLPGWRLAPKLMHFLDYGLFENICFKLRKTNEILGESNPVSSIRCIQKGIELSSSRFLCEKKKKERQFKKYLASLEKRKNLESVFLNFNISNYKGLKSIKSTYFIGKYLASNSEKYPDVIKFSSQHEENVRHFCDKSNACLENKNQTFNFNEIKVIQFSSGHDDTQKCNLVFKECLSSKTYIPHIEKGSFSKHYIDAGKDFKNKIAKLCSCKITENSFYSIFDERKFITFLFDEFHQSEIKKQNFDTFKKSIKYYKINPTTTLSFIELEKLYLSETCYFNLQGQKVELCNTNLSLLYPNETETQDYKPIGLLKNCKFCDKLQIYSPTKKQTIEKLEITTTDLIESNIKYFNESLIDPTNKQIIENLIITSEDLTELKTKYSNDLKLIDIDHPTKKRSTEKLLITSEDLIEPHVKCSRQLIIDNPKSKRINEKLVITPEDLIDSPIKCPNLPSKDENKLKSVTSQFYDGKLHISIAKTTMGKYHSSLKKPPDIDIKINISRPYPKDKKTEKANILSNNDRKGLSNSKFGNSKQINSTLKEDSEIGRLEVNYPHLVKKNSEVNRSLAQPSAVRESASRKEVDVSHKTASPMPEESINSHLESLQNVESIVDKKKEVMTTRKNSLSPALVSNQAIWIDGRGEHGGRTTNGSDVTGEEVATSRSRVPDDGEGGKSNQMDRSARERRAVVDASETAVRVVNNVSDDCWSSEVKVNIENNSDMARVSGSVRQGTTTREYRRNFEEFFPESSGVKVNIHNGTVIHETSTEDYCIPLREQSGIQVDIQNRPDMTMISSRVTTTEEYRPTYEEFIPIRERPDATIQELREMSGRPVVLEESSPRVGRLLGLMNRDDERRARALQKRSTEDKEWEKILNDVLASVSELERWEELRRRRDPSAVGGGSSCSEMEEAAVAVPKGETPTKVKNLRFKLDPDVYDVPSDDSFYDEENERGWKYRSDEPVQLVSVHASVVPAGQKMVARPVGIDLQVRLTEDRQGKRPPQAKRRSPVSEPRVGWCQELSPVTENVDWRETITPVNGTPENHHKPNGILKTPSPKMENQVIKDLDNPFKEQLGNGTARCETQPNIVPRKPNGVTHWVPTQKKVLSLPPRKKFEPDPEALDRITGYKVALSKPPLPPPLFHKPLSSASRINRAELARKQYLDNNKAAISAAKVDGSKKFEQFLAQAQSDRARIVTSVPDLGAIEKAVSERWAKEKAQRTSPEKDDSSRTGDMTSSRGSTPDDAWAGYVQSCRKHLTRRSQSMSYLETDINIVPIVEDDDKWASTSALDEQLIDTPIPEDIDFEQSQEDLNDSGRARSEHELRVQKSLQTLPLPDWYKKCEKPKSGFLLKSVAEKEKRGWAAAKSLASSTSSLSSCGLNTKRPVVSLRSSRENIPWSRSSPSPDGPALSLALAKAFREPYLGWRARTSTSSGVSSSSPRTSPPSWCAAATDEMSFDGEDAFGVTSSEEIHPASLDDTGADVTTVSMDITGENLAHFPGGEDTCDDINNMSMDTCEIFDSNVPPDIVEDDDETSPQADTGDDIDNLSTDTTEDAKRKDMKSKRLVVEATNGSTHSSEDIMKKDPAFKRLTADICLSEDKNRKEPKFKRYSYSRSIYHSEWEEDEESRGDRKGRGRMDPSSTSENKVIWIESSFVGSRTTTSIVVLPTEKMQPEIDGHCLERPASR